MNFQDSFRIADKIINEVNSSIWEEVALKAVSVMPKYLLSKETHKIIDDFTKINEKVKNHSGTTIVEDFDPNNDLK